MATGRAALAELMDSISVPMDTAGKFNELQQRLPPTEGRHDVGAIETNRPPPRVLHPWPDWRFAVKHPK
jgi:hypothetical protein